MKNLNTGNVVGSPQTGSPLPVDALQEFRVSLNTYDAEFTRGSAYIMSAVTHRGTNQRQGSVFGFFQNKNMVSVTDFQRRIPNFEILDEEALAIVEANAETVLWEIGVNFIENPDAHTWAGWRDTFDPHLTGLLRRVWPD